MSDDDRLAEDLDALEVDVRNVGDLAPFGRAHQRRRARELQQRLDEIAAVLDEWRAGAIGLVDCVCEIDDLAGRAYSEVLKAWVDEAAA